MWGRARSRSGAVRRRRSTRPPPSRCGAGVARQGRLQACVGPRSRYGAAQRRYHHAEACPDQGEDRRRTRPEGAPPEAEQPTARDVAHGAPERAGLDHDRLARERARAAALQQREAGDGDREGGGEHLVQVGSLEPQGFLDPKPRDQLTLGQHDPEHHAEQHVGAEKAGPVRGRRGGERGAHRGTRSGKSTKLAPAPAAKKEITATSEGSCSSASPVIPWPEVQPPPHAVPKPMRNPPPTIIRKPRTLRSARQLNSSRGMSPAASWMPRAASDACASGVMATGCGFANRTPPIQPPTTTPAMNTRFHKPTRRQS